MEKMTVTIIIIIIINEDQSKKSYKSIFWAVVTSMVKVKIWN